MLTTAHRDAATSPLICLPQKAAQASSETSCRTSKPTQLITLDCAQSYLVHQTLRRFGNA
jgi:hypothetical protein